MLPPAIWFNQPNKAYANPWYKPGAFDKGLVFLCFLIYNGM